MFPFPHSHAPSAMFTEGQQPGRPIRCFENIKEAQVLPQDIQSLILDAKGTNIAVLHKAVRQVLLYKYEYD